jgi:menaquinone-dependent protoporphyrinogen oxidase
MRALVTVASKHGATAEIGESLALRLRERGVDVEVLPPEVVGSAAGYDAVVIGSAVYAGHWMKNATDFVQRQADTLRDRPVWLFSSGPLGEPPVPTGDAVEVDGLVREVAAIGHRVFSGALERAQLGFGERALVGLVRAPYGDFREWDSIDSWADEIAEMIATPMTAH